MTNTNFNWKNKNHIFPFLLKPAGKDYLWGGRRLREDFTKELKLSPLAETWECSTHPDGESLVANGEYAGWSLTELLKTRPEYMGKHANKEGQLPILIKLIDADKKLSVQVHPDDAYAYKMEQGSLGKTEMWYVLDAKKTAEIIYGFQNDIEEKKLRESLENGTVEKYLKHIPVKEDDIFYVAPGTVHGIGAGALIAEIQENSNLTYRLYDYNRLDKKGKKRELHIEKAMAVIDRKAKKEPRQPLRVLRYQPGCALELLLRCQYFQVERMLINTERCRQMAAVAGSEMTFQVLLCTNGCGTVFAGNDTFGFFKGDCIFIPANTSLIRLHGRTQLLKVMC